MAGTITNVIKTLFTTSGADETANAAERVGRAQTRLGQASANNSRQFAAQASGLGGLVAAYAGAAATIFSIQAAFDALARAAQAETVVRGTNALAAEISQSGPRIIKTIQEITQGQLTLSEAAQNANIALSAGFNASQIEQFASIAQKASQALGRDFTDSLQRVVRGVAKLEPELLDELGIFTRIEPAVQRYARQLGISAASLNEFQRRQAFANATIEEGNRKFSIIDTSSESLQKTLEQLRVRISELSTGFLQIVGGVLAPFANFLTGDIGNALLAFGFILSLVFSKANEIVSGFVNRTGTQLSGWTAGIADKAKIATAEIQKLQAAINAPINTRQNKTTGQTIEGGGLLGIQTAVKAGQDPEQAKRFAAALDMQRTAATLVPSQLNKITQAYKEQKAALEQLGLTTSQSYKNLGAAIERNNAILTTSGTRISLFIGSANLMNTIVNKLTGAFNLLGSAVNILFTVISVAQIVGTLLDVDLLGEAVKLFKDLSQASKELSEGLTSVALAFAGGGAALTASLKSIGASDEMIAGAGDRIKKLRKDIELAARPLEAVLSVGTGRESTSVAVYGDPTQETRIQAISAAIKKQQDIISTGTGNIPFYSYNAEDIEQARVDLKLLGVVLSLVSNESEKAARVVSQLARASGLAGEEVATLLAPEIKNSTKSLRLFGVEAQLVDDSYTLENATDQQRRMLEAVVLTRKGVKDFSESVAAGSLSVITAGSSIAGLESQLLVLKNSYTEAIRASEKAFDVASAQAATQALQTEIDALEGQLDIFRAVEQALISTEKVLKDITGAFSKEITLFDTAAVNGLVNSYGQIAANQNQIDINQAAYLRNIIDSTKYAKELAGSEKLSELSQANKNMLTKEEAVLLATVSKEAEVYDKATAAVKGKLVDITRQAYELAKAYKEISATVSLQLAELKQQAELAPFQLRIDDLQVKQEAAKAAASFQEAILENKIRLTELKVDNAKINPVEGAKQINTLKDEILSAQRASLTEQLTISNQIITAEQALLIQETEIKQANIRAEAELQRAKITSDLQVLQSSANIYSSIAAQLETSLVTGGNAVGTAIITAINNGIKAFVGSFGSLGSMLQLEAQTAVFTPESVTGQRDITAPVGRGSDSFTTIALGMSESTIQLTSALNSAEMAANTAKESVTTLETEQIKASANTYLAERSALESKRELNRQAYVREIALLEQKGQITSEEAEKRLAEAEKAGGAADKVSDALERLTGRLSELQSSIQGSVENAFMSLNTLIITGEGSIGEIFGSLFKSIQEEVFKQTIATPISNMISNWLVGGLQEALNNKDIMGSPLSGVAGSAVNASIGIKDSLTKNTMGDAAVDSGAKALEGLGTKISSAMTGASSVINSAAASGAQVVQGAGQMLATTTQTSTGVVATANTAGATTLMSSLGPILAVLAIIAAIMAIFGGKDKGGSSSLKAAKTKTVVPSGNISSIPQMASGGLRRDRLPTLLEPGEFVMRRPAVNKLGVNNLAAMNATGKAPASAPTINIKNEGTQKEATASAPRFDGEKYVIDVIMRDLSSNGPIRRSLRGGAL